jgi:uncharacterized coiled-coil DUF342 family protein
MFALFLLSAVLPALARGSKVEDTPRKVVEIDVRDRFDDPVQKLGEVTLRFTHVNPLRYEIRFARDAEEFAPPNLAVVGFIPGLTSVAEDAGKAEEKAAGDKASTKAMIERAAMVSGATPSQTGSPADQATKAQVEKKFQEVATAFGDLSERVRASLEAAASTIKTKRDTLESIQELVRYSDALLDTQTGLSELVATAHELAEQAKFALERKLPSSKNLLREMVGLELDLEALRDRDGWSLWWADTANSSRYRDLKDGLSALAKQLEPLEKEGALRKEADGLDAALTAWRPVLAKLNAQSFEIERPQHCDFPFFKKREYTFTLTTVDRLQSDPTKALSSQAIAKVICLPVVVPSAGLSVGGVNERKFGFIQTADGSGGVKSTIGIDSESDKDISALALLNARLLSFGSQGRHGFYISAGTELNLGDSLEGDRIGYVVGASLSLSRRLFVTLGIESKRKRELAGGFAEGDDVPEGLSSPPTRQSWSFGGFLGVTVALN